ncbi:MAG: MFS transporter [Chitinophagaceae bacterium]|nr:MFS transporter [Chitinophagaceae bacterium]
MENELKKAPSQTIVKRFLINSLAGTPSQTTVPRSTMRLAVAAFYFSMGLCFASWASRIPDIKTKLNLSEAELGGILLALPVGQLVTMPISGRLVTKYGSRTILSIAILLYALELTNIGWATEIWQLVLALFIFGVVGNLSNISVNTQGVLAEKIYERPIMTSFHGAWSIAGFTGALIGLLMVNLGLTPHQHFFIVAALVFIVVFSSRKYLIPGTSAPSEQKKKKFFSKPDAVLVQLGIIAFCSMAAEGAMFDWSGVYFKEVVEAPKSLVILGYASFMIMMATGRFVGDRIIASIGRRKMLQLGGILITSGLLISVIFPTIVAATIGFLIVGFGVSSIVPTVYSAAARTSKIAPGMALAAVSSISFLGFLLGPPLIGYIAQLSSLRSSFALVAVLGLCISVMVTRLKVME